MYIRNNINAVTAHKYATVENKTMKRLASGFRINSAADDAAGLSISEKMRAQIRGLKKAEENTQNAISLVQTAEGGLGEIHSILARMRELAVQSANGTYTDEDRLYINDEIDQLKNQIDNIAHYTEFNTIKLLDGSLDKPKPKPEPEPEPIPPPPEPEPEPEPIPPNPPSPPVGPPDINFTTVKNKYAGIGIKAERIDNVDFSKIEDGSAITIEGVKFEFDTDGVIASGSIAVDISGLAKNDYAAMAAKFKTAFESSKLYSGASNTPVSKYLELDVKVDTSNPKIVQIALKDALGDFIAVGNGINIQYSPTNQVSPPPKIPGNIKYENVINEDDITNGIWATRVDKLDFSTIGDGSIISVQGVNFEFDTDGETEVGSVVVDIKSLNKNDYYQMAKNFKQVLENSGHDITVSVFDRGSNTVEIHYEDDNFSLSSGEYIDVKYYPYDLPAITAYRYSTDSLNINQDYTSIVSPTVKKSSDVLEQNNYKAEFEQELKEIQANDEILSGDYGLVFQVGANTNISLKLTIEGATTENLGINDAIVTTVENAGKTITSVDSAITMVSDTRAKLGAVQNRLESTFNNLSVSEENLTASESRIRDCDFSKEMILFFKTDVMTQVAQTMLAQANEEPKSVLHLLR